uniref:Myotubularin-related protein 9 n=1 Tax=Ornithorhynchus anatinus TaxID=9258 RepID=A0A6I8NAI2_ORNAN
MEFAELIKTPRADNVVLHRPLYPAVEGTLCLTGHHLILSSRQDNTEELWLLHANIDSIDKRFVGSLGTIVVKCKDLRVIRLDVPGMDECLNIASSIEALSTLGSVTLMYPFFYRPMFEVGEDGWQAFLPQQEFERVSSVTGDWRLSHVNKDFSVCPSYPALVTVPAAVDDEALRKAAQFRHGGRFPVLSYYHKKNGMVMMRSGQPLTGTNGRRCKEDEKLVNATLRPGKRGYIIDTRALNVAQQARAKGGGFEQEAHYPQWRRIHKAVERYPILQESLIKLVEACNDQSHNMDRWLSKLEASNWLTHVKEILTTACLAAQCLDREGASVLVHGTEGTDSTLQVTSLAQILLDPRCRTLRGFQALVEREWLQVQAEAAAEDHVPVVLGQSARRAGQVHQPPVRGQRPGHLAVGRPAEPPTLGRGVPALDPVLQVPGRSLRRDGCHHPVQQGAAGQGQRPAPATGPAGDRGQGAGEPLRCLPRPPPPSPASPRPLTLTLSRRGPHGPSAGSDLPARSPRHVQRLSPPPPRVSPLLRGGGGVPSGCPGGRGRPPEPGPVGTGGSGPWVSAPLPLLGSGSRTGTGPGSGPLLPSAPCPPLPPRAVGRKPGILGSLCRPQGPSEGPVGAT